MFGLFLCHSGLPHKTARRAGLVNPWAVSVFLVSTLPVILRRRADETIGVPHTL
jgi:hypothetical protein